MQLTPAGRVVLFYLSSAIFAFQAAFGRDDVDAASGAESCRCAVLYSGHVRSFAQPRVHLSHKKHLLEQLKKDCHVDVFMYISVEDEVPLRYRTGHFEDSLFFTPHTPQYPEVELAVGVLDPISIEFHQEQAGFIPNDCENSCESNAFWQLYKMKAVYRMMQEHETATKLPYTWVIRSRLDIAWMLPLPPLSRFPPSRVYSGHNFFPLADQFLLVPRRFAETLFGAVRLCYDCKVLQAQSASGIQAQTEILLSAAMRGEDGSGGIVPLGYYEFPVVIVRNNEGGVCEVLQPFKCLCEMLRASGNAADPTASTEGGNDRLGSYRCMAVMQRWYQRACVEMFPPLDFGTVNRIINGGGGAHAQRQRMAIADRRVEPSRDAATSFEEATGRVEGVHGHLSDLLGMVRVDVAPTQTRLKYFVAHHFPLHRANPLRPGERGPLDEVSVIEGYRLSEADFNRVAVSFSCFLSETVSALAERAHDGRITATEPPRRGGEEEDVLVLKTTAAEEEGLQALVNCSLADSLHDVWGSLLENKFEPSETVCYGSTGPCLERALAESRDLQ